MQHARPVTLQACSTSLSGWDTSTAVSTLSYTLAHPESCAALSAAFSAVRGRTAVTWPSAWPLGQMESAWQTSRTSRPTDVSSGQTNYSKAKFLLISYSKIWSVSSGKKSHLGGVGGGLFTRFSPPRPRRNVEFVLDEMSWRMSEFFSSVLSLTVSLNVCVFYSRQSGPCVKGLRLAHTKHACLIRHAVLHISAAGVFPPGKFRHSANQWVYFVGNGLTWFQVLQM